MQVEIETRVTRLEEVFADFVSQTSQALQILQKEMLEFKNEMRREMLEFKNEMRQEISILNSEMLNLKNEMKTFKDEMLEFKNEMKIFKDEMLEFKNYVSVFIEEINIFKSEINRKWGDLARKMGTITEDIIAPGAPDALMKRFGIEILDLMVRRKIKDKDKNTEEFDVILIGNDNKVYLIEVKSTPTTENVLEVLKKSEKLRQIIYNDKEIVPIFGSLYIDEDIQKFATKNNIYVLGMKGDYLAVLN
ncbi:MAG: hypothetical protein N2258_07780 [Brevinematales bacterium]|nr:hypothetical protein [Brevinematales bacterium]